MFETASTEILARVQFAFTVSFHIIFPAFTIGLASYLAVLNAQWLRSHDETYPTLFEHWKKIFAVAFGMGVVSGIVMSYQFGTNWSVFSDKAGPVVGPLMAYEVLSAFFLEAGQFVPEDWWAIVFNPSFPYRLVHMVLAAFLTTAFVVGAVGALHLLRDRTDPAARRNFSMAMWMAVLVTPLRIFAGDLHGINTLEHQPAKVMAMEGHFESHPEGAPLYLFGIPDQENQVLDDAIGIPKLSSLILRHDLDAPLDGLDTVPREDQPPVAIVFWSFRVMVAVGFAMLGVGLWSLVRWVQGRLYQSRWLHRSALAMGPSGFVAVLAGWVTTEVGRQPFTVYGLLRTGDSLAPVAAPAVGASLMAFIVVYFFVFGAVTFYMLRLMGQRPGARPRNVEGPTRTAGVTPAPQIDPDRVVPGE